MLLPIEPIDEDAIWTENIQSAHNLLKKMVGIKDEVEELQIVNQSSNDRFDESNLLSLSIS